MIETGVPAASNFAAIKPPMAPAPNTQMLGINNNPQSKEALLF